MKRKQCVICKRKFLLSSTAVSMMSNRTCCNWFCLQQLVEKNREKQKQGDITQPGRVALR